MDTLEYIKGQISKAVSVNKDLVGLEDVLTHIERAEVMLKIGRTNDDDDHYCTDVIYRTNHAYEGILKEAYYVLAEKSADHVTPNNIEKYLLEEKILNKRVVKLLENYRREWRNTSTHDYRLFFNSGEAFLAILSVTAFVHLLLTQILDKLFYNSEMARISPFIESIKNKFNKDYDSQRFVQKVMMLLMSYDGNLQKDENDNTLSFLTEREFLQGITAHINSIDNSLEVLTEPIFENELSLRPDMIIQNNEGDSVLVELKIYKKLRKSTVSQSDINQMITYLTKIKINEGFLVLLPRNISSETELICNIKNVDVGKETINIHVIRERTR